MRGTRRTETGLVEIGDIIIKIENTPINTEADLFQALEDYKPGDKVRITVSRVDVEPGELERKAKEVVLTVELKASTELQRASSDVADPSSFFPFRPEMQ
jgi:S1-C subfamily serine protease